eukprot:gene13025-8871_t
MGCISLLDGYFKFITILVTLVLERFAEFVRFGAFALLYSILLSCVFVDLDFMWVVGERDRAMGYAACSVLPCLRVSEPYLLHAIFIGYDFIVYYICDAVIVFILCIFIGGYYMICSSFVGYACSCLTLVSILYGRIGLSECCVEGLMHLFLFKTIGSGLVHTTVGLTGEFVRLMLVARLFVVAACGPIQGCLRNVQSVLRYCWSLSVVRADLELALAGKRLYCKFKFVLMLLLWVCDNLNVWFAVNVCCVDLYSGDALACCILCVMILGDLQRFSLRCDLVYEIALKLAFVGGG